MCRTFKKILALLTTSERRRMWRLFAAILIMAFVEVAGVASIMPFMAILTSPETIEKNRWLGWVYREGWFANPNAFLIFVGTAVLFILIFSNAFTAITTRSIFRFTRVLDHALSSRLISDYAKRPYLFFVERNSADLSKNVLIEVQQVITGVVLPGMQMMAKIVVTIFMIILLVIVEPMLAVVMLVLLGGAYAVLYSIVQRRITNSGHTRVKMNRLRYQVAAELFGGIKEILVLGREDYFTDRFSQVARIYSITQADLQAISQLPRYVLETLVFGGLMLIILYHLVVFGQVSSSLPIIALYAVAGYRIMPALQYVFHSVTQIKFYLPAVDVLSNDFGACGLNAENICDISNVSIKQDIALHNVCFSYPGARAAALHEISVTIPKNSTVAFVGETGSGKTTLVDVILGLLKADSGEILVDGKPLVRECMRAWRSRIGYVPQQIFMADDTVAHNIALGIPEKHIDKVAIEKAARVANIHEFMVPLERGYETVIGERGVRLSGGQRQRIGIARALYHNPDILIMDEGTSALDGMTEEAVMQALDNLAHEKTILLIAHRLSTVRQCDRIYYLENGRIISEGTYDELITTSEKFRAMARLTTINKPINQGLLLNPSES